MADSPQHTHTLTHTHSHKNQSPLITLSNPSHLTHTPLLLFLFFFLHYLLQSFKKKKVKGG